MRNMFNVAAKLLGLLCLVWAASTLVQTGAAITAWDRAPPKDAMGYAWVIGGMGSYGVFNLLFALGLIFATDRIADILRIPHDAASTAPMENQLLKTGIMLIGVCVLVLALPALARAFLEYRPANDYGKVPGLITPKAIEEYIKIVLGALLAFRTDTVLVIIQKHQR